jgi:hypothetical protein
MSSTLPHSRPNILQEASQSMAEGRMSPGRILLDTHRVINERRDTYGRPDDMMAEIAARWSLTLGYTVTPAQAVLCMMDLKMARLANDPGHHDSLIDVVGYAALLPEAMAADADEPKLTTPTDAAPA